MNHWHKSAKCLVAVDDNCDLMFDSEVLGIVKSTYMLVDLQFDDAQAFLIVVEGRFRAFDLVKIRATKYITMCWWSNARSQRFYRSS